MTSSRTVILSSARQFFNCVQRRSLNTSSVKLCDSSSDKETVVVEKLKEFKVVSIGLNRPNKRNCVNSETSEKLYEAFCNFESDDDYNVAILHGIGGNFCAGYDLDELANVDKDNIANEIVSRNLDWDLEDTYSREGPILQKLEFAD